MFIHHFVIIHLISTTQNFSQYIQKDLKYLSFESKYYYKKEDVQRSTYRKHDALHKLHVIM